MKIYCIECAEDVDARLTSGEEVYSHRPDLYSLPFWICDCCNGFVGCHHKTNEPTKPLGVIPNKAVKQLRSQIHRILDPIWKNGYMSRKEVYKYLSDKLGREYHTADLRSVDEANEVKALLHNLNDEVNP